VYVAAKPPSGWCQGMAARHGRKIIYIPIGSFSNVTLKKLRQFHVLEGHHIRKFAHHYI
jgi:Mor family transcriptional regulator